MATRRIATHRIHIEAAIERIKNFQITHFFPGSLCHLAAPITFFVLFCEICAFLTTIDSPLVPPPAHENEALICLC